MPIDTTTGEMQETINWLYRLGFFLLIGGVAGAATGLLHRQIRWQQWLLRHNPLTGLPNQAALLERLRAMQHQNSCLLVIEIDNILEISNTLGYRAVEDVILAVVARLRGMQTEDTELFHYHPERLAILLSCEDDGAARQYAHEVHELLSDSVQVEDIPVYIDTYLGVITNDGSINRTEDIVKKADIAMARAQELAQPFVVYDESIDETSTEMVSLLGSMLQAINAGQFRLFYQPKVALAEGRTTGVEALVRWEHPELGLVPPDRFLPAAERTELINTLTLWVVEEGCRTLAEWIGRGWRPRMAVNLSVRNLAAPGFFQSLSSIVENHGIPPELLEIEVTESGLMTDPEEALRVLDRIRERGHHIAIDDFGTGYSSLAYLTRLPAHAVKIDQAFIRNLGYNEKLRTIVEHTLALAKGLGFETVAEGVESDEIAARLKEMGCDIGQGYYFGKPMDAEAIAHFFADSRWPVRRAGED
ncbi:MAG: bifunctional diguanylate cyclase/phosphodiesterase [Gammaproteobacteria bacterium]|nr:MAG: bifunctional diguanylate cyclase/phosphodiesterase [Gammaproteobacteria bacterium]